MDTILDGVIVQVILVTNETKHIHWFGIVQVDLETNETVFIVGIMWVDLVTNEKARMLLILINILIHFGLMVIKEKNPLRERFSLPWCYITS